MRNFTVDRIECKELWTKYSRTQGSIELSCNVPELCSETFRNNGAKEDLQLCAIFILLYYCITLYNYLSTSDRRFYQ